MDSADDKVTIVFETKGFSMWPFLLPGARLVVRKGVSAGRYFRGDLVCYRDGRGETVCHRLVRKNGNMFYLRGDNSFSPAECVPYKMLVGRVVAVAGKKGLTDITTRRRLAWNTLIVFIAPLVSRLNALLKPLYKPHGKH
jgi:hypothetical protein